MPPLTSQIGTPLSYPGNLVPGLGSPALPLPLYPLPGEWEVRLYAPLPLNLLHLLQAGWLLNEASGGDRIDSLRRNSLAETSGSVGQGSPGYDDTYDAAFTSNTPITTGGYLSCADSPDLRIGARSFYVGGWVYLDEAYSGPEIVHAHSILFKGTLLDAEYGISTNNLSFNWEASVSYDGSHGDTIVSNNGTLVVGEWIYVAMWYDHEARELGLRFGTTEITQALDPTHYAGGVHVTTHPFTLGPQMNGKLSGWWAWGRIPTPFERSWLASTPYIFPFPPIYRRSRLPMRVIKGGQAAIIERGGFAEGRLDLAVDWEEYGLVGNERVDIYVGGMLRYRGMARLPENRLDRPESKQLSLQGAVAALNTEVMVPRRYGYGTPVDLSVIAQDLVADTLVATYRGPDGGDPSALLLDCQTVGAELTSFDSKGKTLGQALQELCDYAPGQCCWGFDTVPAGVPLGSVPPTDRFYFRPRPGSALGPGIGAGVGYIFPVGGGAKGYGVRAVIDAPDTLTVVNRFQLEGGPAAQPNKAANGGFEYPSPPGELAGNKLQDYSFEDSLEYSSPFWHLESGASIKTVSDTGGGLPGPRTGSNWLNCDHSSEWAWQDSAFNASVPQLFTVWARRGTPTSPATLWIKLSGRDSSNTEVAVIETLHGGAFDGDLVVSRDPFLDNLDDPFGVDPTSPAVPGYITADLWRRYDLLADFTAYPSVVNVVVELGSNSGSGVGDGIVYDDAAFYELAPAQSGWMATTSADSSGIPSCAAPAVNWVYRPSGPAGFPVYQGGYSVKVAGQPAFLGSETVYPTGSYIEVRHLEVNRASLSRWKTHTMGVAVGAEAGTTYRITFGVYLYGSDGTLQAVEESATFVGSADGVWDVLAWEIPILVSDMQAEMFLRIHNNVPTYLDAVMLCEGSAPIEYIQHWAWWEGDKYQVQLDTDSSLVAPHLSAAAQASIQTYGVRERSVQNDLVTSIGQAIALATSYFNAFAVPSRKGQVQLVGYKGRLALDGLVRVANLLPPGTQGSTGTPGSNAGRPPDLAPNKIEWAVDTSGIKTTIDLDNERPSLATLLAAQARLLQRGSGVGTTSTGSSAAPKGNPSAGGASASPANAGGATSSGAAADAAVVHLAGVESITGPKTFQAAAVADTPVAVTGAVGQTAPLLQALTNAGAGVTVDENGFLDASGVGVAVFVKAGTPVDADFGTSVRDGIVVIDTVGSLIWSRLGGAWKSAALT